MTDTATQPGVDKSDVVVGNTQRNSALAAIAEASRKQRDEEILEHGGEVIDTLNAGVNAKETLPETPEGEVAEPEIKAEGDDLGQPEKTAVEPEKEAPAEKMITVKVDGQEMQVPESQVLEAGIRYVQKDKAADRRLDEATRLLRTAQEAAAPKKEEKPLPDMDEAELANRIRNGTDEEAQEAMRILKGRQQATPEEITQAVEGRVLMKIDHQNAISWFQNEYKEIVSDPYLLNIAIAEEARLRNSGDERPFKEVYQDVGESIRKKLQEWKGGKPSVSTSTSKQERKSEITNLPAASVRQQQKEQPKPKTTAQTIEEMRKARGQR
jgi:HPt (histidine-containing phosphotransfer) domain-containing protein